MLDSSDLIVTVSQVHGLKMIEASGEIDMSGAEVFRDAIDLARQEPVTIVSLRDVTYIDSTGLGILVREHNRRRASAGPSVSFRAVESLSHHRTLRFDRVFRRRGERGSKRNLGAGPAASLAVDVASFAGGQRVLF